MSFTETVHRVTGLAAASRDAWDAQLRKRHPAYPIIESEDADDGPPPLEEEALRTALHAMPREDLFKLTTVMSVGRGESTATEFSARWRDLARRKTPSEELVGRLLRSEFLDADLSDGLSALSAAGVDVETVSPQPA